jgi:hypothetical protein
MLDLVKAAPGIPMSAIIGGGDWLRKRLGLPGIAVEDTPEWAQALTAPAFLERANALQAGLGHPDVQPANDEQRIFRKGGAFLAGGGPAAIPASLMSVATSEAGRGLDKAGVTGGYGEFVGGLLGAPLVAGVKAGARGLIPKADPSKVDQALELMGQGVRVAPSQVSEGQTLGYIRSGADATSLMPSAFPRLQGDEFTTAVSKTFGENAPRITQKVIDSAQSRIGGELERLYKTGGINANTSPTLVNSLAKIEAEASSTLQPQQLGYVSKALDEALNAVASGPLRGEDFWNMIKYDAKSALNNAMRSADPTVKAFAIDVKRAMMKALEEGAPAEFRADLARFNKQYMNLQTVRDLALRNGGKVSPQALLGRVVTEQGGARGDLGKLADAGKSVLSSLPNSGTAQRATGAAIATGTPFAVAGPVAGAIGLTLPHAMRGLLDSKTLARLMIEKSIADQAAQRAGTSGLLGGVGQVGRQSARSLPAGMVGLLGRQNFAPQNTGLLGP